MSDNRHIVVLDFETGGKDRETCEVIQIGATVIDRNSLAIKDQFESLMKPASPDKLEDEALGVNGITREQLATAPEASLVFPSFAKWIQKHNIRKDKGSFGAPIACGWGIDNFDMPIFNRYCSQFGYWDKKWNNQNLLNPIFTFDVMKHIWLWSRTNSEMTNLKLGDTLEYMGVPRSEIDSGAHSAMWDVKQTARIAVKLLQLGKYLTTIRPDTGTARLQLKGCFTQ